MTQSSELARIRAEQRYRKAYDAGRRAGYADALKGLRADMTRISNDDYAEGYLDGQLQTKGE